jgi:predicted ArsR family transcriptional regulator
MKAMSITHAGKPAGRAAVLARVKRDGPVSADGLAEALGITAMAVRQHLAALEAEALVEQVPAPREKARGRPLMLWQAAEASYVHFADSHAQLALDLLTQMKRAFGEAGLDKLLAARNRDQEKAYRAEMARASTLKSRLDALARIREREGYMPEVKRDADGWLFLENHCPICAAAKECQKLCRDELALFQKLMGRDVTVERASHILAGATRCTYRVKSR